MPGEQTIDYATLKKGGFMRQKQKNHFSLRLGVVGGTVTAEQLAAVIETAKTYGHGYVHLTSRQGIEIPFIQAKDVAAVKERSQRAASIPACADRACAPSRRARVARCAPTDASTRRPLPAS